MQKREGLTGKKYEYLKKKEQKILKGYYMEIIKILHIKLIGQFRLRFITIKILGLQTQILIKFKRSWLWGFHGRVNVQDNELRITW